VLTNSLISRGTLDSRVGTSRPTTTSSFFLNSLPPTSPTSSYDFVILPTPIQESSGHWQPKLSSIFPNLPQGLPDIMEDSFQWRIHSRGCLRFLNPFLLPFVMFFSSKVYYFSLQRTPRFFLSVWKYSLVSWRPFHRCQMQTFDHLNKVHTQTCKNPVCNYQLLSSLKIPKKTRGVSPCGLSHLD
jgi:hypothetical protein